MHLLRSWNWYITLDYDLSSSPDTLRMLLVGFVLSIKRCTASKSTVLTFRDLTWSTRFLQPKRNFFNHLYCNQLRLHLSYNKYSFMAAYAALRPSSNSWSVSSRIKLRFTFIYAIFKSHSKRSNPESISAPTITILSTTAGIFTTAWTVP